MRHQVYLKIFKSIPASTIIYSIKGYRYVLSPDNGVLVRFGIKRANTCAMYPSCSSYAIEAVSRYGAIKGSFLGIKRIFRCHPWQKNNIDPVK